MLFSLPDTTATSCFTEKAYIQPCGYPVKLGSSVTDNGYNHALARSGIPIYYAINVSNANHLCSCQNLRADDVES